KLYSSREGFRRNASRINHYLKEWNAVGFRSAFMLHNLAWLPDLNVAYEASTFDTDPFEPQPDGVDTIFPFWVHAPDGRGFVELPYTLVQDFNLFVILKEATTAIWEKKTEWIAAHRGMVLLNVHPDYMSFGDGIPKSDEYPAGLYGDFLGWVKKKYEAQYWHALPKDLARVAAEIKPERVRRAAQHICMLSASIYESDNRVMRYAQTLIQRGDSVDVFAVGKDENSPTREVIDGVNVIRLQAKTRIHSKIRQLWGAARFLTMSSFMIARNHLRRRYDLIHVHNMPDFLVFSAWLPRLTGTAVILDIHDICPEFYESKFHAGGGSPAVRLLKVVERLASGFVSHVIISNHLWQRTVTSRSVAPDRCSVFINSVDTRLFCPTRRTRNDDKFVIIYPGSLNRHQGLDIAIKALAQVADELPSAELHLYGMGPEKEALIRLSKELGMDGKVRFFETVPLRRMPEVLANADIGVVPKRASDFFGNEAFSTKIMEFMSQGLPVIVSRTRIDTHYYSDDEVRYFESENVEDLARAFLDLAGDRSLRERLSKNGRAFVERNSWDTQKHRYLGLVDSLQK
ncbi:MAG: glycosyltransferase family 4 protein, partial [Gloeobacteraceae cyanobacterium ES-bin-144]|nr:glycosyltransferase family 4 protein [Verrucomicrobiales bacterium]